MHRPLQLELFASLQGVRALRPPRKIDNKQSIRAQPPRLSNGCWMSLLPGSWLHTTVTLACKPGVRAGRCGTAIHPARARAPP